ncbi:RHS domain-containing protein [Streptomyces sp. NPDC020731]|uniref:RHS domain-containing protein n=1 Tax=Streptomyces sp. NPDC020731 TaxID=3365085 RepID=UPI0037A7DDC1
MEQATTGAGSSEASTPTWEREGVRPLTQTERTTPADTPQHVVDERFYAIVTDLVGTPTELVSEGGEVVWRADATLWGLMTGAWRPPGGFAHSVSRTRGPASGRRNNRCLGTHALHVEAHLRMQPTGRVLTGWLNLRRSRASARPETGSSAASAGPRAQFGRCPDRLGRLLGGGPSRAGSSPRKTCLDLALCGDARTVEKARPTP